MILVIEGGVGSGKSRLTKELAKLFPAPVYRAFRGPEDGHNPGKGEPSLALLPLHVNSWHEDLYAADAFSITKPDAVLDRSMPSALAYEEWSHDNREVHTLQDERQRQVALHLWKVRMEKAGAAICLMETDSATATKRCNRLSVPQLEKERRLIRKYVSDLHLPFFLVENDNDTDPTEAAGALLNWAEHTLR